MSSPTDYEERRRSSASTKTRFYSREAEHAIEYIAETASAIKRTKHDLGRKHTSQMAALSMLLLGLSVLQLSSEYVGLYVEDGFHHTLHHSATSYEDVLAAHWSLTYLQIASCANLFLLVDAATLLLGTRKCLTATLISTMMMVGLVDFSAQLAATAIRFSLLWHSFYIVQGAALLLNLMALVIVFASLAQLYLVRPLLLRYAFAVRDAQSHLKSEQMAADNGDLTLRRTMVALPAGSRTQQQQLSSTSRSNAALLLTVDDVGASKND